MPNIRINDIGPICEFETELKSPGLYVLEGSPGAGKTTILRSLQLAVDGRSDTKPTKRDGAARGIIEVAGKTIRITKTTRAEGELDVDGLGDLSIADLHQPPFKDAKTRDRHRIVTLLRLAGAKANVELFYPLVGVRADFRDLVPSRQTDTDDLVEMAQRIKACFEEESRRIEKKAESARLEAKAHETAIEGVDTEAPHDEQQLADAWQRATSEHAAIKEKRDAYLRTLKAAHGARERLATLPTGKSVVEAKAEHAAACAKQLEALDEVTRLERLLESARAALAVAESAAANAAEALTRAESEVAIRGELDAAIEAASGAHEVTQDEVDDAAIAVGVARKAAQTGNEIRSALKSLEKAKTARSEAKRLEEQAERLRAAAAGTMEVLSGEVAKIEGCPLRVRSSEDGDPRLVLATARSDNEYFEDRSDGQKWAIVMQIAARPNRLIPLSQAAYGELAPSLRRHLHELAKSSGCYVVTAVANDCELRCTPYVESNPGAAE